MSVVSYAEHHEIKLRPVPWVGLGDRTEHVFILLRRRIRIRSLASHAMSTLSSDIEWTEECFFRETVVAVGMVGRHTALIAEKEVCARPRVRRG
jgi:hypothetical protein